MDKEIGVVIIGRNEGERLKRCLKSVILQTDITVYVDSGSSDGSVEFAESIRVDVLELDTRTPFSASRARNSGFEYLTSKYPFLTYIHFIDGDCELNQKWLSYGCDFLNNHPKCAIVTGSLEEREPEKSIYNMLCNIEWNVPSGKVRACGGIFTIRISAFLEVQGFNPAIVAGEEPDLCYRLIEQGWDIYKVAFPMAVHDADMTRFSQWWRRMMRSGHSYAHGFSIHGWNYEAYGFKESVKIWLWAFFFPLAVILLSMFVSKYFLVILTVYFAQFLKIAVRINTRLKDVRQSIIYSYFIIAAKWPQLFGQLVFIGRKMSQKGFSSLEHR